MKLSDEVRAMVEHEQNEIDGPCGPGYRGKCWGEARTYEELRARLTEAEALLERWVLVDFEIDDATTLSRDTRDFLKKGTT